MSYITQIDDPIGMTGRILRTVPEDASKRPVTRPVTHELGRALIANPLVLLVAERGVGATAAVETLGWELRARQRSSAFRKLEADRVMITSVPEIQAGCSFVNQIEGRIQVIDGLVHEAHAVLAIESFHLAGTAGATKDDLSGTVANILDPYLRNGLRVIAMTTPAGLDYLSTVAPDTVSGARVVRMHPATPDETVELLTSAPGGRRWPLPAVREAVALAERLMPSHALPGAAAALLRETATEGRVTAQAVRRAVTTITGLRSVIVANGEPLDAQSVEGVLGESVIGQANALRAVSRAILRMKSGVVRPGQPVGSFLLLGKTGVGKTETAKCVARFLYGNLNQLIVLDMSEYVGGGCVELFLLRLVQRVIAQPHAIVLLDEVEKADPDVRALVLQLLDEARLTAPNGMVADFSAAIIFMTSNLVTEPTGARARLGNAYESTVADPRIQLLNYLPAELINRIDEVIIFNDLDRNTIASIASREIQRVQQHCALARRRLTLEFTPALVDTVARTGFDPRFGARAMQRAVRMLVEDPLADLLASSPSLADAIVVLGPDGPTIRDQVMPTS